MNIPVIYINRNNLGASQFKHPKNEIIIWKKKWVKITHSCKWLIQSLFVTKEQTIIEILIIRKKKLLHKLNLYILPTRYIKQKNKMQKRCGLLLSVLKERKEYVCVIYIYIYVYSIYVYMHVVDICAYIILYHFWREVALVSLGASEKAK